LPKALGRFLSTHPSIDVDLEEKPSQEIVAAVAAGLADFGIAADTVEIGPLETLSFRTDRLVLIVPHEHPLASRDAIALREVLDQPFVGLDHGSAFQAHLAGHAGPEVGHSSFAFG
jgi:DNA-binding transcriptional LysR family regulator